MPTILNPYLIFNGNCKEAMNFYNDCFGGELTMQTVAESPMATQLPPNLQNAIMHSQLISGSIVMMASDMNREKLNDGNGSQLCLQCSSEEEVKRFFAHLEQGGTVTEPLAKMFWGGYYGSLIDKYGKYWSFNYEEPHP
jgi:PhnB protein